MERAVQKAEWNCYWVKRIRRGYWTVPRSNGEYAAERRSILRVVSWRECRLRLCCKGGNERKNSRVTPTALVACTSQ